MANTIEFIIKATDQASVTVDKIEAKILGSNAAIGKSYDETANLTAASSGKAAQGIGELGDASDKSTIQIGGIQGALLTLNAAMGASQQIIGTFKQAWDFAKEGAAIERIQTQFSNSAAEMGMDGENLMKRMQAAVHGTVDDEELAMTATKALTMGVVESGDQMVKALELARAVSIRFGTDTQTSFQSIIQSADMLSERGFKRMGIILPPLKSLVDDYAKAHGMAAGQVDTETQKTILLNAALEKGQDIINKVGTQGDDTTTKMQRFEATVADVGDTIKTKFVEVIGGPAIDALDVMLTGNQRLADAFTGTADKMKLSVVDGGMSIDQYNAALRAMADRIREVYPALAEELYRQKELNFIQVEGARVGGIFAETQKKIAAAATEAAAASAEAEQGRVKAITDEEAAMKRANDAYREQIVVQSEARALAISYTRDEQKLADLQSELATLDTQIAAQGAVRTAQVNNQKMSEEQRALTLQKLAVAQENITQIQRKAGETDAEYNLRLTEAKGKVDSLSQSLGTHTVALGGATKAQDEQRKSLEGQIAALQKATETQKATDVFNALTKAFQDGKIGADEYTARAEALNNITHLYTDTALKAATQQELLINSFVDPNSATWRGQLLLNEKAIDGVSNAATEADKPVRELISSSQKPIVIRAEADTTSARDKIIEMREIRAGVREDKPIEIKTTADTAEARDKITTLHEQAASERNRVTIRADADTTAARDKIITLNEETRLKETSVNVNAKTDDAERRILDLLGIPIDKTIKVDADTEPTKKKMFELFDLGTQPVIIRTVTDTAEARDKLTELQEKSKSATALKVTADTTDAAKRLAALASPIRVPVSADTAGAKGEIDKYQEKKDKAALPVVTPFKADTAQASGDVIRYQGQLQAIPPQKETVMSIVADAALAVAQELITLQSQFKDKTVTWTVKSNEAGAPSGGGVPGAGAQAGADFVVPPGYAGDRFPLMVSSGERVIVMTPAQQQGLPGTSTPLQRVTNNVNNFYDTLATKMWIEKQRQDDLDALVARM